MATGTTNGISNQIMIWKLRLLCLSLADIYCIFMCHLSIEKALKGLFVKSKGVFPSKSHSLLYFVEKLGLKMDDLHYEFLFTLNKISVPTRYPEDLRKLVSAYSRERTKSILDQSQEIQSWIKQQ
jgi:HEPN domain-containing protein